jgi:predicted 2-oxoglutarate/Fe(II)-dependent dioxygenase YbiX
MLYHVFKLLGESETSDMVTRLMMSSEWRDGAESASGGAKSIKRNLQLSQTSDTYSELKAKVVELLMNEKHTLGECTTSGI